jgi:TonB family protein
MRAAPVLVVVSLLAGAAPFANAQIQGPVYKAGDAGVVLPVPVTRVKPAYPDAVQSARIQGTVVLTGVVLPDGIMSNIRVTTPLHQPLDQEAILALRQWRFRPGTKDLQPVAVEVSVEMSFSLRDRIYTAADGVTLPQILNQVDAIYPDDARDQFIEGTVRLSVTVLDDGSVGDVSVVTAVEPSLDEAAIQAVKQWRFRPGTRDGQPVNVRVEIDLAFMLR